MDSDVAEETVEWETVVTLPKDGRFDDMATVMEALAQREPTSLARNGSVLIPQLRYVCDYRGVTIERRVTA